MQNMSTFEDPLEILVATWLRSEFLLRMCSEVRRIYENCAYKCARPQFHATLKICFFTAYCTNYAAASLTRFGLDRSAATRYYFLGVVKRRTGGLADPCAKAKLTVSKPALMSNECSM